MTRMVQEKKGWENHALTYAFPLLVLRLRARGVGTPCWPSGLRRSAASRAKRGAVVGIKYTQPQHMLAYSYFFQRRAADRCGIRDRQEKQPGDAGPKVKDRRQQCRAAEIGPQSLRSKSSDDVTVPAGRIPFSERLTVLLRPNQVRA